MAPSRTTLDLDAEEIRRAIERTSPMYDDILRGARTAGRIPAA